MATERAHVPFVVEEDEDGVWCAETVLRPGVAAYGYGDTPEAAIADLREGLLALVAEVGFPETISLELEVA